MANSEVSTPSNDAVPFEAVRVSGPDGFVEYGKQLTEAEAIDRRKDGEDVVIRGETQRRNRGKAREIEEAAGQPVTEDQAHARAGRCALPHFHQVNRDPAGHTFYEIGNRKARKPQSKEEKR